MTRNLIPCDGEQDGFGVAFTAYRNAHDGAFGAFEQISDFSRAESVGGLVVHFCDHVARADAGLVRRRAYKGRQNDRAAFARRNGHAHAVIFAALLFAQQRELARIEKVGVWIQDSQHPGDCALVEGVVGVNRHGVILLDEGQHSGEVPDSFLKIAGARGCGFDRRPIDPAQHCGNEQNTNNQHRAALLRLHLRLAFSNQKAV